LTRTWADTESSVQKVLEHLKTKQGDIFLGDSMNSKFLTFHKDITDEYGMADKQHSWAVIEKQEEIIMYGPYYPDYSSGEHSEDIIIKQTQELLEAEDFPEHWTVYVFSMNSPCLARNTDPCMLNLVHKARDWWSMYAVKTHIGFQLKFPLISTEEKQEQKTHFKSMNCMLESKQEDEKKLLTKELNMLVEAAHLLLLGDNQSLEEHMEKGKVFSLTYTFSSEVCEGLREEMRVRFQQCWMVTVQDRCAEFVREKLTAEFNQRTVQLFIKDIHRLTRSYLQIGKLKL
ncbi:hypothetical protein GOODEAATRI_031172, partial [Goodea atripinnis]